MAEGAHSGIVMERPKDDPSGASPGGSTTAKGPEGDIAMERLRIGIAVVVPETITMAEGCEDDIAIEEPRLIIAEAGPGIISKAEDPDGANAIDKLMRSNTRSGAEGGVKVEGSEDDSDKQMLNSITISPGSDDRTVAEGLKDGIATARLGDATSTFREPAVPRIKECQRIVRNNGRASGPRRTPTSSHRNRFKSECAKRKEGILESGLLPSTERIAPRMAMSRVV